ncbi:peptidase m20 [Lucifera butyrica]|uniref:Peptidase m20 n=1 Tax=Lucifera butyrica TaxID=1351585 RepID=A0A498RBM3_9FIRM|nr:amidohydrolase [Lucifera butyrica]VBB08340.1 peptidase m20 [Lucifera butyrica]
MNLTKRVQTIYEELHKMPEPGFRESRTAAYLAEKLRAAGFEVKTGLAGTGVTGLLCGKSPGPTVGVRADMDALLHWVEEKKVPIHSCGHDAHAAIVLAAAERAAAEGILRGALKVIFQPAEETLEGALQMIAAGAIDDVDQLIGLHLRPIQEAGLGQATPALFHGASVIVKVILQGTAAHGARPHLGVNVIDAAAAAVNAVNAIHVNPVVPATVKVTRLQAGGASLNAIPDKAEMALDLRAQNNETMEELLTKVQKAVERAADTVDAKAYVTVAGRVPAAEYNEEMVAVAREAILAVLGPAGLLSPIYTPGGEDFHFYTRAKPAIKSCYLGLGADLVPGLHHPAMQFDTRALNQGVSILLYMVHKCVGGVGEK